MMREAPAIDLLKARLDEAADDVLGKQVQLPRETTVALALTLADARLKEVPRLER